MLKITARMFCMFEWLSGGRIRWRRKNEGGSSRSGPSGSIFYQSEPSSMDQLCRRWQIETCLVTPAKGGQVSSGSPVGKQLAAPSSTSWRCSRASLQLTGPAYRRHPRTNLLPSHPGYMLQTFKAHTEPSLIRSLHASLASFPACP